jgi:hypothetical protein
LSIFLTVLQHLQVGVLPITWQPGLEELGQGSSATVNQSLIDRSLGFAFKRTSITTSFQVWISEICIMSIPQIKANPNIQRLEEICWETSQMKHDSQKVWPVLVSPKA